MPLAWIRKTKCKKIEREHLILRYYLFFISDQPKIDFVIEYLNLKKKANIYKIHFLFSLDDSAKRANRQSSKSLYSFQNGSRVKVENDNAF